MRILKGFTQRQTRVKRRQMKWVNWPTTLKTTKRPREMKVWVRSSPPEMALMTMNMTPTGVTL